MSPSSAVHVNASGQRARPVVTTSTWSASRATATTTRSSFKLIPTERNLFEWAKEVNDRGAGEILFTSMNHDGVKQGFACEALSRLASELTIPVIASGGAGKMEDFRDVFALGHADAALAASVFHFGQISIPELKAYLKKEGINIRL